MIKYFIYIILFSFNLLPQINWYNHPQLNWQELETDHFIICFHDETKRSAVEAVDIVEKIYDKITNLYDFYPESKTYIVIQDVDDYSNGAAYFYDNKIIIWAKPLDYDLRGSHRWLQDVITHEFTHIVQLGASMKYSRNIPGTYLQVLSYENEKREDVLYGYPNQIVSYPIPGTTVPPWFAEGTAQYMFDGANYDYWDSIRDMILRDRVINNNLLSFDQMNIFGKKGIGNESTYNQGFSLTKFIVKKYGEESLKKITDELSKPFVLSINKALKNSIGISGYEIYSDWKIELSKIYQEQLKNIEDIENYLIIENNGTTNIHPTFSKNGLKIAYLSNKENDYFTQTDLYIYSLEDSVSKKIASGVKTSPSWINDSLIVYSKISKPNINGSKFFDLYSYDFIEKKQNRLTNGLRLFAPHFDKKNNQIYAINTYDGTSNIFVSKDDYSNYEQITNLDDGTQIFSISSNDSLIIFDAVVNHGRKLFSLDKKTKEINNYISNEWDSRDPTLNNNQLIYSDDKYGIFNLVLLNDKKNYLSNVSGGAFMPDISNDGRVVFSLYQKGKYQIAILDEINFYENKIGYSNLNENRSDFNSFEEKSNYYINPKSDKISVSSRQINENELSLKNYESANSGPFIMPRITYDYNTFKPGLYLFDNDFLNKSSILSGISFNSNKDIDLFLLFDNNQYKSSYFFNFYWITRNKERSHAYINSIGEVIPSINWNVDYKYQLFSADIGNRFIIKNHKFWLKYTYSKYRQFYSATQIQEYNFNGPNTNSIYGKGAYDYFRAHVFSLEYNYDGRKPHYLYNMIPKNGFNIKTSISYELNSIFEEFKVNQDYGGFIESLTSHNTFRYKLELSNNWLVNSNYNISFTNNFKYFHLSNYKVDDFLYFFGGGLEGLQGYTFYEPTLQGPRQIIFTNKLNIPVFNQKAIKVAHMYLNSVALGIKHQIGKSFDGKIIVGNIGYDTDEMSNDILNDFQNIELEINGNNYASIQEYLDLSQSMDALDNSNLIPESIEHYLYPDIYAKYDDNNFTQSGKNILDLKERYKAYKYSLGVEIKLLGYSFYSYPTALTYEYHIPLSDPWESKGKQYLKILFDFN